MNVSKCDKRGGWMWLGIMPYADVSAINLWKISISDISIQILKTQYYHIRCFLLFSATQGKIIKSTEGFELELIGCGSASIQITLMKPFKS